MGGKGQDAHDQLLDRKTWTKMFKDCRCKRKYKKHGEGGNDVQCMILSFPYFGRCYWRKCPKIKADWEDTKRGLTDPARSAEHIAWSKSKCLENPFTDKVQND